MKKNPSLVPASDAVGKSVVNTEGKGLGKIEEIMIDYVFGRVAYAVLSFGGFFGMGDKLFAIPWEALRMDIDNDRFVLNVDQETLKAAEGFDPDHWPDMANPRWGTSVYEYYGYTPYWM